MAFSPIVGHVFNVPVRVQATYLYFEFKRARPAAIEVDNLRKLVAAQTRSMNFTLEDFKVFNQGGPEFRRQFEKSWLEKNRKASGERAPGDG